MIFPQLTNDVFVASDSKTLKTASVCCRNANRLFVIVF